jgi:hypothetical protein
MDRRFVTWFWFTDREIENCRKGKLNELIAARLRWAADEMEKSKLDLTEGGNVFDAMGGPVGYFEKKDEAKKYTR